MPLQTSIIFLIRRIVHFFVDNGFIAGVRFQHATVWGTWRWHPQVWNSTQKPHQWLLYHLYRFVTTNPKFVHLPKPRKIKFQNAGVSITRHAGTLFPMYLAYRLKNHTYNCYIICTDLKPQIRNLYTSLNTRNIWSWS